MTRIYIPAELKPGTITELPEGAARHLVAVLRMQAGEEFVAFNGHGGEYELRLEHAGKRGASARVLTYSERERESKLHITLAQCVSKGERMDYTLQKAVELGVSAIVPLLSSRSVVRMDGERWEKKLEHWRGVIVSACEQSGRTRIPPLAGVSEIEKWLPTAPKDALRLTLAPGPHGALHEIEHRADQQVVLLVGPEGGLSANEIADAEESGFQCVRLGPRVLRTETAALVCLSNIQALWGDLR
ncbi:MAG TPA: 16S rRNA (uracil(1498)-N(3))-methyltransferase [Nevskiaceae bacterium]|nr:16S rRNA (uracil(1498)-N(3))-methyltransferase [Nevskiaceae bacterium]